MGLLSMRRARLICGLALLLLLNVVGAQGVPPLNLGGGGTPPPTDKLITLLHNMCPNSSSGCFAQISSAGHHTANSGGLGDNDAFGLYVKPGGPSNNTGNTGGCFANNGSSFIWFDGSTNPDSSYNGNLTFNEVIGSQTAGPQNPYNPCYSDPIGASGTSWPFSAASCDVLARMCGGYGGGHACCNDGSPYFFDLNNAITLCVNAVGFPGTGSNPICPTGSRGHWFSAPAMWTARHIPMANPAPATPTEVYASGAINFTSSYTAGGSTISNAGGAAVNHGDWITGPGLVAYTEVAQSCSSGCNPIPIVCPSAYQVAGSCISASETSVTVSDFQFAYWSVPNAAGQLMPAAYHAYFSNILIPGTTKFLIGGAFPESGLSFGAHGCWVFDYGSMTVNYQASGTNGCGWGYQAAPCYDAVSNSLLGSTTFNPGFSGTLSKGPASNFANLAGGYTTTIATLPQLGNYQQEQILCMQDPVNGSGHEAVFKDTDTTGTSGAFSIVTDVDGTPAESDHTFSNASILQAPSRLYRTWAPSTDATFMWGWEGGGKVFKLPTSATLTSWGPLAEVTGGAATGDIPQGNDGMHEQQMSAFDIGGASACHAALLLVGGDAYIFEPPGCAI